MNMHQRKYRLWRWYRLTPEEYDKVENLQKTTSPLLLGGRNNVDHNHSSGQIRGLLDHRINRALGFIEAVSKEKAPEILRALANYLEDFPVTKALGRQVFGIIGLARPKTKLRYGSENGPLPVVKSKKNKEKKA